MSFPKASAILLDAQLVVLLAVGATSRAYIRRHKRLQAYAVGDFDALIQIIAPPTRLVLIPNVLSEASNLLASVGDPIKTQIFTVFRGLVERVTEIYVPSRVAVALPVFTRLGLADAALLAADSGDAVLLTADDDLFIEARRTGRRAENFKHVRRSAP